MRNAQRARLIHLVILASMFISLAPARATEPRPIAPASGYVEAVPSPAIPADPMGILRGPELSVDAPRTKLPLSEMEPQDRPLPINLATALRLAGARPLVIAAAQASVAAADAQLDKAKALWLPSVYTGAGYYRHDGATQGQSGNFYNNTKEQFMAGGGVRAEVSGADAIFAPLAARHVARSREIDLQTARNDALFSVAQAYFTVQQARGRLAGAQDVVAKSGELRDKLRGLGISRAAPTSINRAFALLADFEQSVVLHRETWRNASADLTQVLRLDPAAVVAPMEPPHLRVTLISASEPIDNLIPIGLTSRPELASQQALVQATLARIRQERLRPLIPSLVLGGGASPVAPGGYLTGGIFASGANGVGNPTQPREDVSVQLIWGLDNLGFGNRALVRERRAEQQQTVIELFRIQDRVAGEVTRAHAQLESAAKRVSLAETEMGEAYTAYTGSIKGLGEVVKVDDMKLLVHNTLDVVDSIRSLDRAYDRYYGSVNDYNIAQFALFRALGYPADVLTCQRPVGPFVPVDTHRPVQMAPAP